MSAREEQVKLTATGLNNFGIAIGVAGYVTPLLSSPTPGLDYSVLIWLFVGVLLHLAARWSLGILDENI